MDRDTTPENAEPKAQPAHLDQGWTDQVRDAFYNTSQGSKLVPYDWFGNLEQAGSDKPFMSRENLGEKFGYLYKLQDNEKNSLPIGFVKAKDNPPPLPPDKQKEIDNNRIPRLPDVSKTYPTGEWL